MPTLTGFIRKFALISFAIFTITAQAQADVILGEIRWVAFDFAPQGWAKCDGSILQTNQNSALFSLLGTMYGGNGTTTFALPDMRGRSPVGADATHLQGSQAGKEQISLVSANLPLHTHTVSAYSGTGNSASPTNAVWANTPAGNQLYRNSGTPATMASGSVGNSGNGQAFSVMQPYSVLNCIIATMGIYPSRP